MRRNRLQALGVIVSSRGLGVNWRLLVGCEPLG